MKLCIPLVFFVLAGSSAVSAAASPQRPTVVVLAQVNGSASHRTFGAGAGDGGAAGRALIAAIKSEGFTVVRAGERGAATSGDVPLTDGGAAALARQVKAGIAVVVGIHVRGDGRIRGTRLTGARASVTTRVIDVDSGRAPISESVNAAGWGATEAEAAERAAATVAVRIMRTLAPRMKARWARPTPSAEQLEVAVHGVVGWPSLLAVIKHLRASAGIAGAELARFERGRVVLAVSTRLPASRVARAASGAMLPVGRLSARAGSRGVQIDLLDQGTTP